MVKATLKKIIIRKQFISLVAQIDPQVNKEKIFCLNSGNCGSKYLVELFKANGLSNSHHEKKPDLDEEGVQYYLDDVERDWVIYALWRYRRNIYMESSNRLFALQPVISKIFPNARYIHLHRDGKKALESAVNKTIFPNWIESSPRLRYASNLAGPKNLPPFERACHYWNNYNRRIINDLEGKEYLSLKFSDLVQGNIAELEKFVGYTFEHKKVNPVNTKENIKKGKSEQESLKYENWPDEWKEAFDKICGDTNRMLGY